WVARIVPQNPIPQNVRHRREGHRRAGMARIRLLNAVHCERSDCVYAQLIKRVAVFDLQCLAHQLLSLFSLTSIAPTKDKTHPAPQRSARCGLNDPAAEPAA